LALNEGRAAFVPTLWKRKKDPKIEQVFKQVWFPGVHGSAGGGDTSPGLSDIALAWMVEQVKNVGLDIDVRYLMKCHTTWDPTLKHKETDWATEGYDDMYEKKWYYKKFGGYEARKPGGYEVSEEFETNEKVHRSVHVRIESCGSKYAHPELGNLDTEELQGVELEMLTEKQRKFIGETFPKLNIYPAIK
jgi:hypothetical protein